MTEILFKKTKNKIIKITKKSLKIDEKSFELILAPIEKKNLSQFQIEEINRKLPLLVEIFFSTKYQNIKVYDLKNIFNLFCQSIINREGLENYFITIGLGASEQYPSIRIPAYIITSINILKKIINKNLELGLPKIRIFKANYAGIYANNLDEKKVLQVSDKTFLFLNEFIAEFYPELISCFNFDTDLSYKNTSIYDELIELSFYIEKSKNILDETNKVMQKGEKYGKEKGRENALFYAAAHPIYNKSITFKDRSKNGIFKNNVTKNKIDLIFDIGGKSQKDFNSISHYLIDNLHDNKYEKTPLISAVINVGKAPVYYKANENDILINEKAKNIHKVDFYDLKFISQYVDIKKYELFLKSFREQNF